MLLLALLESDVLSSSRGDVIIFNNTSAEHPSTYDFVRRCAVATERHGIPFFWVEYQTYEDARNGEWTRLPSYRLVNDQPRSPANPDGYHWRGEVFEELVSWAGYLPNQFRRICTQGLKLDTSRAFMADWLAGNATLPRLGHHHPTPRVQIDDLFRRHERNGGGVPKDIFVAKRKFALTRPFVRPEQRWADYSSSWEPFDNPALEGKIYGGQAKLGRMGARYLALVGLRGDEPARVQRVNARNGPGSKSATGEIVYMPLADMGVTREDVNAFWRGREWDLELAEDGALSNCVYCFLKGAPTLQAVHASLVGKREDVRELGPVTGTPSDFAWWERLERIYARDLVGEERQRRQGGERYIGFAGNKGLLFERMADRIKTAAGTQNGSSPSFRNASLPCDCTE